MNYNTYFCLMKLLLFVILILVNFFVAEMQQFQYFIMKLNVTHYQRISLLVGLANGEINILDLTSLPQRPMESVEIELDQYRIKTFRNCTI